MKYCPDILVASGMPEAAPSVDSSPSFGLYSRLLKRPLDIALVLLALPIILPVAIFVLIAVAIDGGSPFYTQTRLGKSGRHFRMWKFRSMVRNADQQLETYLASNPAAREEWNSTQKLKRDPRITSIGRFIRKSSLDELPQLWNVLRGDMSIVGPRPMMVDQAVQYPGADYYHMRPGVTGLWQITDRNDSTFAERATFDAQYARSLSLRNDVMILRKTFGVVLRCTGY